MKYNENLFDEDYLEDYNRAQGLPELNAKDYNNLPPVDIFDDNNNKKIDKNDTPRAIDYTEDNMPPLDIDDSGPDLSDMFVSPVYADEINTNQFTESGWVGDINLDLILSKAIQSGASDIHLTTGQPVYYTILGDIKEQKFPIPDIDTMNQITDGILSYQAQGVYVRDKEYDTSYVIRFGPYVGGRFRVNVGKSFGGDELTFRYIANDIPSMQSLGIDKDLFNLFQYNSGVTLVCGPTSSGKTTTLASILHEKQKTQPIKIVTVEKPIEFVYPINEKGLVIQREIPTDCLSFENGLTSAMRMAPNVILIGEIRNKDEVNELLRASETGHLAVSTIHTVNNITTLNRIISLFTAEEKSRILNTLADSLRGIVNQILVKKKDGKSRIAVREMLLVTPDMQSMIRRGEFFKIREIQESRGETMEQKLVELVKSKSISY